MRKVVKKYRYLAFAGFVVLIGLARLSGINVAASWIDDEGGRRYESEEGESAVGMHEIDGLFYYFDEQGYMQTGKIYVEAEDAYYYADEAGVIQFGVIDTEDHFFITDANGKLKTGFVDYDGGRYYFNANADYVVGWFKLEDDWYYAGNRGELATGIVTIDGTRYYFDEAGVRSSDAVVELDGVTYIILSDGSIDENATRLYPVYQYISKQRKQLGQPEILLDTRIQACAMYRALELNGGFHKTDSGELQGLIAGRGIASDGGYELAYGGKKGYEIDDLLEHIRLDSNFSTVLSDGSINYMGIGIDEQDGISYYDMIFVSIPQ